MSIELQSKGYYKSPAVFDKYDLVLSHDYLKFSESGKVQLGGIKDGVFRPYSSGKIKLNEMEVSFSLIGANNHRSHWTGSLMPNGILFTIDNPDFEMMEGLYVYIDVEDSTIDPPQ